MWACHAAIRSYQRKVHCFGISSAIQSGLLMPDIVSHRLIFTAMEALLIKRLQSYGAQVNTDMLAFLGKHQQLFARAGAKL